ncbi:MAG: DUF1998 domain-containing protein [Firmicutes bacterium]|nr:DUF1998 domain-containing protein [Bacillota bacterium]
MKIGKKSNGASPAAARIEVVGSVRQSQLMFAFGIGSMIDFVDTTAMILGTDTWTWANGDFDNPYRLNNKNLENLLNVKYFIKPKPEEKKSFGPTNADIEATLFPKTLYCLHCRRLISEEGRFFKKGKLNCVCGKDLVPSRFVAVCPKGHIEDFPFSWWVHGQENEEYRGKGADCCAPNKLKMYFTNNRTDMANLWIECMAEGCGAKRSMRTASAFHALANYRCSGNRPWLGDKEDDCAETLKLCMRTESNVYFPITQSALTVPPFSSDLAIEIQKYLGLLSGGFTDSSRKDIVRRIIGKHEFRNCPPKFVEELFIKLEKKAEQPTSVQSIMEEEYIALMGGLTAESSDNFITKAEEIPPKYSKLISRVVAVERLTVVTALTGFTRLNADDSAVAPLSKEKKEWLPAIEQKGEGVFIEFDAALLKRWADYTKARYDKMGKSLGTAFYDKENFSPQYVFLHTFAHLFIRELSNICGYSAASMKEKIYSTYEGGSEMNGILIYTSSADAEGSLGGLIEQAKKENMELLIDTLIERASWCSMDPLCISSEEQGVNDLNFAACYACTLIPETSCEFRNLLLDRAAVVGTTDNEKNGVLGWLK